MYENFASLNVEKRLIAAFRYMKMRWWMNGLWKGYVLIRKQAGFMRDGGKRQSVAIDSLSKFLKHDDARKVTKIDLLAWRDNLIKTLAAKTVTCWLGVFCFELSKTNREAKFI